MTKSGTLKVLACAVLVVLATWNLSTWPATWFDEGMALQGPINLVGNLRYAMRSSEGFRILDQPLIANGPGLALPIATVFATFGVGLLQARLVVAAFLLATVVLFYRVSRALGGPTAAMFSTIAFLAVPDGGLLLYGRQALGNLPAFCYFLAGCYFLIHVTRTRRVWPALGVGVFWALTIATKGQYWIIFPLLAVLAAADAFFYRTIGLRRITVMIVATAAGFGLWQVTQYFAVGPNQFAAHLQAIRSSAGVSVFAFRPARVSGSLLYLLRAGFPIFVFSGLCLAITRSRRENPLAVVRFFLVAFVCVWSSWYAFVSVGWPRYALGAFWVGLLFFGSALEIGFALLRSSSFRAGNGRRRTVQLAAAVFVTAATVLMLRGLAVNTGPVFRSPTESSPLELAAWVRQHIPRSAVIESWEWEIDILLPLWTFHHPTNRHVDCKTAELQFSERCTDQYDPSEFQPRFLIDGPFSKSVGAYKSFLASGCCEPMASFGDYSFYEVRFPFSGSRMAQQ